MTSFQTINQAPTMKSAYELAMERLNKSAPTKPLTDEQKREIAALDSQYKARIAEREIFLQGEIAKADAAGDFDLHQQFEKQLSSERRALEEEMEEKKEAIRNRTA